MKKVFDNIPLHINIMSIFLLLTSILACSMLYTNHRANSEAALDFADVLLAEVSEKITERTARMFGPAFLLAEQATLLPDLGAKPDLYGHPSAPLLMKILAEEPSLISAYVGYEDGEYLLLSHIVDVSDQVRESIHAPHDAHYNMQVIVHRDDGKRVRISKFLDSDLRIIASNIDKNVTYDPRLRPWYRVASSTDKTVLTDLYIYSFSQEIGLTAARRFDGRTSGVFGVDLALSGMSKFLAQQKVGENSSIVIFKKNGQLMAHPDVKKVVRTVGESNDTHVVSASLTSIQSPVLNSFYEQFIANGSHPFRRRIFKVGDTEYIARAAAIPTRYGADQYLGIIVPISTFTGPIVRAGTQSLLVSLALLGVFTPILILVSRRVSHPIRQLEAEAERIGNFDLDAPVNVPSRITEIKHLARSMAAMKSTLSSFGVYVPKALVRQIMQRQITPELGGERRKLTLLFSDIANFTTMSEGVEAEALARYISLYFEELGGVILNSGGTIDKFIGDAIMAFWNAPIPNPDHEAQACFAALRCRQRSRELNDRWEPIGNEPLRTRFGLHSAEAIVGNIGSSDRMDYTAMGAAVNLASRLEGLNKHFGTEILVSETIAQKCSDRFLFRSVGKVLPKGTLTPVDIFELVGLHCDTCAQEKGLAVNERETEYCMWWEKAFALYLERRWDEALKAFSALSAQNGGDPVAEVYIARSKAYLDTPPDDDWTGVEAFQTK